MVIKMNTIIYFVRHGQTDANKARIFSGQIDTPLNDTGREQVRSTCKLIESLNISWDIIVSSTLSRAFETAQIINRYFPIDKNIIQDISAIERSFGKAEGIPITDENYQKIMNCEFEDEESEEAIINRAQNFIKKLLNNYSGKNILVVTHSHFLKGCFKPYLPELQFNTKTVNAGLSRLIFDENQNCISADLIMK